ncbi:MAG: T9SS type A sorting domain-containing protein [Chitinophagales bacterium]|nr:T9SS type A sorting domain-containing protein [Chitinophagales bacterium]
MIKAIAQIIISNAELEGVPCGASGGGSVDSMLTSSYCPISGFYLCEGYVGLYNTGLDNDDIYPNFPKQGNTYATLAERNMTTWRGSISTRLSCYIRVGVKYSMTLWAANLFYEGGKVAKKTLVIWGNADSCSRIEKLWESGQIDTGWHQYAAILTPKLQDYEYIHFRIGLSDSNSYFLSLDSLSDIYPFNGNDVTTTIQDTAFTKANSTCIKLNATANITTYDTVYWQDAAGNKIAEGFNGGTVCPDSSTYYVIAMRDSVQDCAGIWWSYDTVKVTVNTGTAVATPAGSEAYGVNIFPNPAKDNLNLTYLIGDNENLSVKVTNVLGQEVLSNKPLNASGKEVLATSELASGIYFLKIYERYNLLETKKFIVEH